ncbi:hypothetical protein SPBR_02828 [Sporothrix brasiliensis 5110]|uniref:Stress activated map kinase interacting n=1 Tax=Sporothrix brasiliensis 5110 TaxID=1398154 RepID=A0A0C2J7H1_9PEZI|nr:uncharacterized protein SPBR_02828 [Sporothrix brasiliensis 5110]KIH92967.1 hypothetical protein SPBR_02828 [Sporothrix brasiliensis 5110]
MGLVDYDSDGSGSSDGEAAAAPTKSTTASGGKKPFQKLVDRANSGKILVNLPSTAAPKGGDAQDSDDVDDRPAKRAKVGAGGSRFSGFGSFLPPPKKTGAVATPAATASKPESSSAASPPSSSSSSSLSSTARPGVHLKTSSEAAFKRRDNRDGDAFPINGDNTPAAVTSDTSSLSSKMSLPPPKAPSIPKDQKAAEDVKLVGNPLMFMPLSVSRKPGAKNKKKPAVAVGGGRAPTSTGLTRHVSVDGTASSNTAPAEAPPPKKKVSLFSLGADDQAEAERASAAERAAEEAAAAAEEAPTDDYASTYQVAPPAGYGYDYSGHDPSAAAAGTTGNPADTSSVNAFANDMHLSAKERRELFGRTGAAAASAQIAATFNMDHEYRHNEALRQAEEGTGGGQQQSHNPVRTLMPGKHSLRQLVNQVHSQQDALEETFAKNRQTQRESGGKYGWR